MSEFNQSEKILYSIKMVVTKNVDRRWYRRYKTFFIFGTVIFAFQLYLALKFLTIHSDTTDNKWNPYKITGDSNDLENSVNSARRIKDGLVIDDEDIYSNLNINDNIKLRNKQNKLKNSNGQGKLKNNNTILRVEEFDFVPGCEINTKEAISAIHRAKTQKCKQELVNVTCLAQRGLLYPKNLPNYCLSEGKTSGKSLGCYKDEKNYRILSGYFANLKTSNSPEYCIQLCLQSGYPYAGVEYS